MIIWKYQKAIRYGGVFDENGNYITGYPWIDNFTYKRDTVGKMSEYELFFLNRIKYYMAESQRCKDLLGKGEKVNKKDWLDKDGYLNFNYASTYKPLYERREQVNKSLNNLLKKNKIVLSKKVLLMFTINSELYVSVSGNIDKIQLLKIENILNKNNYGHILFSEHKLPTTLDSLQYSKYEYSKFRLRLYFKKYTSVNLDDVVSRTRNVENIKKAFFLKVDEKNNKPVEHKEIIKRAFDKYSQDVLRVGYSNIKNLEMKIGYKNNKLYDYNTKYGYGVGQTKWYEDIMSIRGDVDKWHNFNPFNEPKKAKKIAKEMELFEDEEKEEVRARKYYVNRQLKKYTHVVFKQLIFKNGKFVTSEGYDILTLVKNNIDKDDRISDEEKERAKTEFKKNLDYIIKNKYSNLIR